MFGNDCCLHCISSFTGHCAGCDYYETHKTAEWIRANREAERRHFEEMEAEFRARKEYAKKYWYTDEEVLEADRKGITLPPKQHPIDIMLEEGRKKIAEHETSVNEITSIQDTKISGPVLSKDNEPVKTEKKPSLLSRILDWIDEHLENYDD